MKGESIWKATELLLMNSVLYSKKVFYFASLEIERRILEQEEVIVSILLMMVHKPLLFNW